MRVVSSNPEYFRLSHASKRWRTLNATVPIVLHHRYHAIDLDTLWNVLEVDIPALAAALQRVVDGD